MRWDQLFRDLAEHQAEAELSERDDLVAEMSLGAWAGATWSQMASGRTATLSVQHLGGITGVVAQVTRDWVLVESTAAAFAVSHLAVLGVVVEEVVVPDDRRSVSGRLGWSHAFRAFARDQDRIQLTRIDGSVVAGAVRTVAADVVEIADDSRRRELVPYAAIVAVRCPLTR